MGHPFGDLIRTYLSKKIDFNQRALAYRSNQDEAVLSKMLNGSRLANFNARKRVLDIIGALIDVDVLVYVEDADEILEAAGWVCLSKIRDDDQSIIDRLEKKPLPIIPKEPLNENSHPPKKRFSLQAKYLNKPLRVRALGLLILGIILIATLTMWVGSQEKDICQHERITCIGNGWCNAQPMETATQNDLSYVSFGTEANLDKEYFVYFDDEFINAENISSVVYNGSKDQWQLIIDSKWIQLHPTWDNSKLWRVDFSCTE